MIAERRQKKRRVLGGSNGFLSGCTWDACSDSSVDTAGHETQNAGLFLEENFEEFKKDSHNGDSNCYKRLSTPSPSKDVSGGDVDRLLASEMNSLSLQERDHVYDEIHGVANLVEETPLFLHVKLDELQEEIAKIRNKPAYDRAMAIGPNYVQDPAFCLPFLRAKSFNAKLAAAQLVAHLDVKQEFFGTNKLCRDIELSDLDENDLELLRLGSYQFMKHKDRAGRTIALVINKLIKFKYFENWARMMFYVFMTHLKDEEVQRRGLVAVTWMHGSNTSLTKNDFILWTRGTEISDVLPLRVSGGVHYCAAGSRLHPALELAISFAGRHLRVRFRAHVGSPLECLYNLASYGIPFDALPFDTDGNVILDEHLAWCVQQRQLLITSCEPTIIKTGIQGKSDITPGPADVLMGGKSKEFKCNPGNLSLRRMVEEALPMYNFADSRAEKTNMTLEIVQKIKSDGGRFLNRDDDFTWKEVDNEMAREKVAHAFRNQRRPVKKKIAAVVSN